ncbi:PLP dependent protein [Methylomarinovum caldicuralii]|uniref:Pyridoxal phosphate homeostasis protein n=1 Tax=Methylomarinovum caldicuralii TaxID=438856 RepID=A0AAU9CA64_9GAMM|nr:YggS family pyridoxal phosphate-dependent enzyme [Methylomarinovum caldicuralii]BCX81394.1 PLP dependent protein [Methylomarinovum caldicuralii]
MNTGKYSSESPLAQRLARIRRRIGEALHAAGRQDDVTLVAVGKTWPAGALLEAWRLGIRHFGENYLQEALAKQQALGHCDITWHFIGPIQSNKTRAIATHFHWVHTVDRLKIARRLSQQRPEWLAPLNVCIQVNVSGEASKAGVAPEAAAELAAAIRELPNLRLRGLMTIPAPAADFDAQRRPFRQLRQLRDALGLEDLSMGMSADLEAAVQEGATLVRIGSALFGPRQPRRG